MDKKVFIGIAIVNENSEVEKALGIMDNMQTGETTWINTECLSDKAVKVLLEQSQRKLQREFLQVVEYKKELPKESIQVIERVPRKGIDR